MTVERAAHDQGDRLRDRPSESNGVAELTAKIVSAYVSNNTIGQSELPELTTTVASRLGRGGAEPEGAAEERAVPVVSVRRSIRA
jgi:predicted transcriptional regulator